MLDRGRGGDEDIEEEVEGCIEEGFEENIEEVINEMSKLALLGSFTIWNARYSSDWSGGDVLKP